jgi:hypothetical protein
MYSDFQVEVRSAPQPDLKLPRPLNKLPSDARLSLSEMRNLNYARTFPFAPDARVVGFLLNADIGPTSYGRLYRCDLGEDSQFVQFEVIGLDNRASYDIVRTAAGVAYVIVAYAQHARERGLAHLEEHISANPDFYAARSLTLPLPWPHAQVMTDRLEASWRRRLSPSTAESRIAALRMALEELASA